MATNTNKVVKTYISSAGDGFNPARDLKEVDQTGFIDLSDAYVRGVIPGSIVPNQESFNNIDDPGVIMPRADDQFAAIRNAQYVSAVLADKAAKRESNDSHISTPVVQANANVE